MRAAKGFAVALLSGAMVAGCAVEQGEQAQEGAVGERASTAADNQPEPGFVSREMLGEEWPLTVASGVLLCKAPSAVLFRSSDGGLYAVNGMATTQDLGEDIDPIWADHPDEYVPKKSIAPLISRGLELCD